MEVGEATAVCLLGRWEGDCGTESTVVTPGHCLELERKNETIINIIVFQACIIIIIIRSM